MGTQEIRSSREEEGNRIINVMVGSIRRVTVSEVELGEKRLSTSEAQRQDAK